jgi:hypothetical protein
VINLVSGATATLARYAPTGCFGRLLSPRSGNEVGGIVAGGLPWACDNDAFSRAGFDPAAFRRMLGRISGWPRCRFVACPDVPFDPVATLARFEAWAPEIGAAGQPVALVGQDGCEDLDLPWDRFDAFFVGGSDGWKESHAAMALCDRAWALGKWVHVGRVNTFRRFRRVWGWGCVDSIDGGKFSKWPDTYFPQFLAWRRRLEHLDRHPLLPGGITP